MLQPNDHVTDTKDEHAAIINTAKKLVSSAEFPRIGKGGKASDLAEVVKIADSDSSDLNLYTTIKCLCGIKPNT